MKLLVRIAPCFFAIIIDALGFGLVYPVMAALFTAGHSPVLPADASASMRQLLLGVGYLLYPLMMFFGASILGDLSDSWGRRKVLLMCMFGLVVSFAGMAFGVIWHSLWLLFLGRALSGLMAGSQPIAQASIADLSNANDKAKNMALISLSYVFGLALGPLLGGVLSDASLVGWFNFSVPFFVAALLSLLAFIWVLLSFRDTAKAKHSASLSLFRPVKIFIDAFENRLVRRLSIVFLLMQIGWSIYFQYLVVHMRYAFAYSDLQMGLLQGMFGIGSAVGLLVGVPLLSRVFSSRSLAAMMFSLTALGVLVAALTTWQWLEWLLALYVSCVNAMAFASMLTNFSDAVDSTMQGWVMGVSSAVMAAAWVLSGLSSNLISFLGTQGLMVAGGVLLVLCSVLLYCSRTSAGGNASAL